MKRDGYTCVHCGKKQSKAKGREQDVIVHHREGIGNWDRVIDLIFAEILCAPSHLETVCPDCHEAIADEKIIQETGL